MEILYIFMLMSARRAVSPILSTIILIGIAVASGGALYGVQNQALITGLSQVELKITDLRIEKDSNGACYIFIKLFNSGSETLKAAHLKITMDNGFDFVRKIDSIGKEGLVPGNTVESHIFLNSGVSECGGKNFTVSHVYGVRVNASSISDSTFAIMKDVKVQNVTVT